MTVELLLGLVGGPGRADPVLSVELGALTCIHQSGALRRHIRDFKLTVDGEQLLVDSRLNELSIR
jgi:hypothetical protein